MRLLLAQPALVVAHRRRHGSRVRGRGVRRRRRGGRRRRAAAAAARPNRRLASRPPRKTRSDPCPRLSFRRFCASGRRRAARGRYILAARLHLRRATQTGLELKRRARRRIFCVGGRAAPCPIGERAAASRRCRSRAATQPGAPPPGGTACRFAWRDVRGRARQRGIQRGIRGGETDASVVARDAKIWAPRVGGAHLRSVRALEARVVAHARTRTSRHRPRTRRHRRPAGTSPSRGGKGADALPTRARTHGARDVLRFERGECTLRFASRAPELTTELCRSTRKLHKLAWHSEGREGGIAPRSHARARDRPRRTRRGVRREASAGARKTSPRRGTSPPAAGDCHATFERRCGSSSSVPNLRLVLLAFPRPPRAKRPDRGARHLTDEPRARHLPGPRPRPARGQDVVFAGLPRSVDRPGGVRPGVEVRGVLRGARRKCRAGVRVRVPRERHRAGTYGGFGADRHEVRRAVPGHRARRVRHERLARPRVPPGARRMRLVRDPDARGGRRREGARHGGCRLWRVRGWVPRHVGDVRRDVAVDAASRVVRPRRDPPGLGVLFLLPLRSARDRAEGRREHQDRGADRRAVPVRPDARDVRLGVADGRGDVRGDVPSERRGRRRRRRRRRRRARRSRRDTSSRRCPLLSDSGPPWRSTSPTFPGTRRRRRTRRWGRRSASPGS